MLASHILGYHAPQRARDCTAVHVNVELGCACGKVLPVHRPWHHRCFRCSKLDTRVPELKTSDFEYWLSAGRRGNRSRRDVGIAARSTCLQVGQFLFCFEKLLCCYDGLDGLRVVSGMALCRTSSLLHTLHCYPACSVVLNPEQAQPLVHAAAAEVTFEELAGRHAVSIVLQLDQLAVEHLGANLRGLRPELALGLKGWGGTSMAGMATRRVAACSSTMLEPRCLHALQSLQG
jgi:hypothetical protein